MVRRCANECCPAEFPNLLEGRVFVAHVRPAPDQPRERRYAWLCQKCSDRMSLQFDETIGAFRIVAVKRAVA